MRLVLAIARGFALMGGVVLSGLILLVCASITGRGLNALLHSEVVQAAVPGLAERLLATGLGPIYGDFEIVEAGMAFAIFAFLPICHLSQGHASVDIFTSRFGPRAKRWLRAVIETVFAAVILLITVQLGQGLLSKQASGQTSFLLQFPIWWAYAASFFAACGASLVALYVAVCAWRAEGFDTLAKETDA